MQRFKVRLIKAGETAKGLTFTVAALERLAVLLPQKRVWWGLEELEANHPEGWKGIVRGAHVEDGALIVRCTSEVRPKHGFGLKLMLAPVVLKVVQGPQVKLKKGTKTYEMVGHRNLPVDKGGRAVVDAEAIEDFEIYWSMTPVFQVELEEDPER